MGVCTGVDPLIERVAIKTLLDDLPAESCRSARAVPAEARSAGRLNHPTSSPSSTSARRGSLHRDDCSRPFTANRSCASSRARRSPSPDIAAQVASTRSAQQFRIVHRDIKPANIMSALRPCKITDFASPMCRPPA